MTGPVVAVDLGVRSVAVAVDAGEPGSAVEPVDVTGPDGAVLSAAVFAPADGSALCVGAEARRRAPADPARFEPTPRRRVDEGELLLGTSVVGVAEACGAVLADAVARASPALRGRRPGRLVLTHPPDWDRERREVLRRAGSGLADDVVLVAEPVAAAAYALWMRPRGTGARGPVAVLDLGSTGAWAAVLDPTRGEPDGAPALAAHRADERFGGDDADELLLAHLLAELEEDDDPADDPEVLGAVAAGATLADRRRRQVLLDDVRAARERLSDAEQAPVPLPGRVVAAWLSRAELEDVLRPALRGVVALLADTVTAAGTTPERLAGVWLTGGGARTPLLGTLVHRELGVPATVAPDPRAVVARGALVAVRVETAAPSTAASAIPVASPPVPPQRPGPSRTPPLPPPVPAAVPVGGPVTGPPMPPPPGPRRPPVPPPRPRDEDDTGEILDDDWDGTWDGDDRTLPPVPGRRDPWADRWDGPGGEPDREEDDGADDDPWTSPPRRPERRSGRRPGRRAATAVAVLALAAAATGLVVALGRGGPAVPAASDPATLEVWGHRFTTPPGWVRAGGDDAARRVVLRPTGEPRGADLIAVQSGPLGAGATDPGAARAAIAERYERSRLAGDPLSELEVETRVAGRDVTRYRQQVAPGVSVHWMVLFSGGDEVSVGCRYPDAAGAALPTACETVVRSLDATAG